MKFARAFLLLGVFACSTNLHAANRVTPSKIHTEIEHLGAKAVVSKYYDTSVWEDSIGPGIRSATNDWLRIAEKLYAGADGAASEDIGIDLYEALAVAPFRVLPVLSRVYGGTVKELCNVSYDAEIPKEGVMKYLSKIRRGLKHARTADDKEVAAQCKLGLAQSLATAKSQGLL